MGIVRDTMRRPAWGISDNSSRPAPGRGRWAKRAPLGLFALLVALVGAGMVGQGVAEARDRRAIPPPGQLINVGGYRLHLKIMGEASGRPTVILEHASLSAAAQWGWIQPQLARSTQVVAYDRPGQGFSDAPPQAIDARRLASDLRTALDQAGVGGPFVLVGHSQGGLTARAFAKLYPADVAGVALVDSRYLDIVAQGRELYPGQDPGGAEPTLLERLAPPLLARLGIMRLADPLSAYVDQLPPRAAGEARAILASTHQWRGFIADALVGESAAALLAEGETLANVPVVVLSAAEPDEAFGLEARPRFTAMHARMAATLSPRAIHRIVAGADHYTIVTRPEYARATVEAVQQVLERKPGRQ